jgi:hypothetical protein
MVWENKIIWHDRCDSIIETIIKGNRKRDFRRIIMIITKYHIGGRHV